MQLDKSRLKQGMYYPPGSTGDNPPYVYFQYETYDRATYTHVDGSIKPYEFDRAVGSQGSGGRNFAAPDSIQIISAGLDRKLGKGGKLLSESASGGDYIAEDDEDNMVSFDTRKVGDIRQ
jgi:hypothetical protein